MLSQEIIAEADARVADARAYECLIEKRSYELWLKFLRKTNWITVVLPAILALFAGTTVFVDMFGPLLKDLGGVAAFLSAVLTAVHRGRRCDEHQADCARFMGEFYSLATRYRSLKQLQQAQFPSALIKLDEELANIRSNVSKATVPDSYKKKAFEESPNPSFFGGGLASE